MDGNTLEFFLPGKTTSNTQWRIQDFPMLCNVKKMQKDIKQL